MLDREPKYEKAIVDRSVANVENFKNHASVIMWSLGNECGGGSNFVAALEAIKAIDPSRPTHYEAFGIGERNPADVDSQMYTGVADLEKIAANSTSYTKPFYLCEYAHAMFNSMGSVGDYNDCLRQISQPAGRRDLGMGGPGHLEPARSQAPVHRVRRRLRRGAQRPLFHPQRRGLFRSLAQAALPGNEARLSVDRHRGG